MTPEQDSLQKGINQQISYTKLAMRNIIYHKSKTLSHFFITILFFTTFLIGVSYLTK